MCICIQTGTNPYWYQPDKLDIFTDSDDKSNASTSTTTTATNKPPIQQILNPYNMAPPIGQPQTILSTLTLWICPHDPHKN